jgi:hypothetical protein
MSPTKENIEYLDNVIKAITFIKWQKESEKDLTQHLD